MNNYKVRVFNEDVDYSGVVHHANYLKFVERARIIWFRESGLGLETQKKLGAFYTIREIDIKYIKPARLDDELNIISTVNPRGKTQLLFYQEIYNLTNENTLITKVNVHVVCVNKDFRPIPISDGILETLL